MDKAKIIHHIENSFLASLLHDPDITDISYNGLDIYYVSNTYGRLKSEIMVEHQLVKDFLRQVANLSEKQFSYTVPYLDISIGRYRIHAVHQSIAKIADEGVVTFSIRIASSEVRINDESDFFNRDIVLLISQLLKNHESIVIGGITSSGKTEFQKYLLRSLNKNERVIVIDNVLELDQVRNDNLDLTCWQVDENNENSSPSKLIKGALRNNPDWLILAEARGEEMVDVLQSALTGMPIITTIHSKNADSLPHRMGRMMMQGRQKIDYQEALTDIYYHFHYYFYLKKQNSAGGIQRYVSEINYVDDDGNIYRIYRRKGSKEKYGLLPECALNQLEEVSVLNNTGFINKKYEK